MKSIQSAALAVLVALTMGNFAAAQCDNSCSVCEKKVCKLEVSKTTKDVLRFKVASKDVCIPGIKLPWQCKRKCAEVRTVCVLEAVKEKKEVCKYDWKVKTICKTCCKQHGLKCSKRACDVCQDDRVPFEYYVVDLLPASGSDQASVQVASAMTVAAQSAALVAVAKPVAASSAQVTSRKSRSPLEAFKVSAASFFGK